MKQRHNVAEFIYIVTGRVDYLPTKQLFVGSCTYLVVAATYLGGKWLKQNPSIEKTYLDNFMKIIGQISSKSQP